jgi:hypothetical protein
MKIDISVTNAIGMLFNSKISSKYLIKAQKHQLIV